MDSAKFFFHVITFSIACLYLISAATNWLKPHWYLYVKTSLSRFVGWSHEPCLTFYPWLPLFFGVFIYVDLHLLWDVLSVISLFCVTMTTNILIPNLIMSVQLTENKQSQNWKISFCLASALKPYTRMSVNKFHDLTPLRLHLNHKTPYKIFKGKRAVSICQWKRSEALT